MLHRSNLTPDFSSKCYLLTGAAGFIGSQFAKSCNEKNISLISVDQESHFTSRKDNSGIDFGQIVDRDRLLDWLDKNRPSLSAVVHLGAVTDTRQTDLQLLHRLNLEYSKFLWNFATERRIPFVYASSAATYGDGSIGYDDNETQLPQLRPLNAYGDSKHKFDLWVLEQERKRFHPMIWSGFKFFNVYGSGENHKGFMSSVILHAYEEIQKTGQVTLFRSHRNGIADGFQKRDFVYVDDVVNVLHFALNKPISRGIFNLGTGQARTFLDLARSVFHALDKPEAIHFIDTPVGLRDKYQYFTEAKMNRLRSQGYELPFASLEQGVASYAKLLNLGHSTEIPVVPIASLGKDSRPQARQ